MILLNFLRSRFQVLSSIWIDYFKLFNLFKELKQAFRLFDKGGNGVVTTQEIGSVLRNLGLYPTEHELQQMLKDIDIDGNLEF